MSILSKICRTFPERIGTVLTQLPRPYLTPRRFEQWFGLGQGENELVRYKQGTFNPRDLEYRIAMATVLIRSGKKPEAIPYEERDLRLYSAGKEGDLVIKICWDATNQRPYLQATQIKKGP